MAGYGDFQPQVRFAPTLALSPDGSQVAYADDTLGQFNVVVQPVAGGPARRLTTYTDSAVRRVAWHPVGSSWSSWPTSRVTRTRRSTGWPWTVASRSR